MTARRPAPRRQPPAGRTGKGGGRKSGKGARSPWIAVAALVVFAGIAVLLAMVTGPGAPTDSPRLAQDRVEPPRPPPPAVAEPRAVPSLPGAAPVPPANPAPEAPDPGRSPAPAPATAQPKAAPPLQAGDPAPTRVAAVRPPAPAWRKHGREGAEGDGRPRIVVVIDDMGPDRRRSDRIAALPGPLTLAWLPYAKDLPAQTRAARARGHEMIVHVPMQPDGAADPGPNALEVGLPAEEIRRRLRLNLSAFEGYVGINNHMGSRFTANADGMEVVFEELAARGLLFLDSKTTPVSVATTLAPRHRLLLAVRDVFLDHEQTPAFLARALAKVEEVARRDGLAIAIGHPHDVTAAALATWLPTLEEKGFQLIPISAAARVQRPAS